ncbi:MAG: glycosyl transferase group 2 family protein [Halothiobacillaceae bacterium]|nr:MAG: glycosyl transferase group 2 family protein [Halothiobacillaceae bacterium]
MKTLFLFSAFFSLYSYFIYPLILGLIPVRRSAVVPPAIREAALPTLSLIITAYNEQQRIRDKLQNTLAIDYPRERLEIIVASDCSNDETDAIVGSYAERGIKLVRADERRGKEYAQLCAIKAAAGEVLVFSDVATQIEPTALRRLAARFADVTVGAISSEDRFISLDGSVVGEGAYVQYEMWLRRLESQRAGLVGLSGSFFAARRVVCEAWDIASPSDFNTALNCAKAGLTAITCPEVVGIYSDVKDPGLEHRRKLRTIIRGMTAIARHREVLNPFQMGLFAFQVWSHKILRWTVPWCMVLLLVLSLLLSGQHGFYALALVAQLLFYGLVLIGHLNGTLRNHPLIKLPYFFVQVNIAIARATLLFFSGKRMTTWTPSQR